MKFVETYNINIDTQGVWSTGFNTCMFLCIKTNKSMIGWHYGADNMNGLNMQRVKCILDTIPCVNEAFLIPGVDRNDDLSLKKDCKTMQYFPHMDPNASRDWFLSFIGQYKWAGDIQIKPVIKHYKEFVYVTRNHETPIIKRDDILFNIGCCFDAEKDT